MKIGVVGKGVIGSALIYGFQKLGHKINVHDIVLDTKISNLLEWQDVKNNMINTKLVVIEN